MVRKISSFDPLLYYFNKPVIDVDIIVGVCKTHFDMDVPQKAKDSIRKTIKIIIKGYLDDLIKKCSIISKSNFTLKRLQITVQAAPSIFHMGILPHEYVNYSNININFLKLFEETIENHNTLIELENNKVKNVEEINDLKGKETEFLKQFPKIGTIVDEINIEDSLIYLGKYYAQHINIAKYQVTPILKDGVYSRLYYAFNQNAVHLQQEQETLDERNSKRRPIYGLEMDDTDGKYMNIHDYAVIGPNEDNYLYINAMSNKVIFEIYRDDVQQKEKCIYLPKNTAPPTLDDSYKLKYIKPINAYGKRSLQHGDILAFKYATNVNEPSKTVYQVRAASPKQLYLRGNMFCTTKHALELINMYKQIDGDVEIYKACIDNETFKLYNPKKEGGNKKYVTIAGRKRNIVIQKGKQYVRYNSEMILLSKLEKMEAKETRAKEKAKIVKKRK